jgi:hypothetical protein
MPPKKFPIPVIPALSPRAYNHHVPQRIHRQACRRCGAGSGQAGKTQNRLIRVRQNGLPPTTREEGEARRTKAPILVKAPSCASGVPVGHTRGRTVQGLVVRCPPGLSSQGGQYRERRWSKARPILSGREAEPTDKNAERGAERCHYYKTLRGTFQRPGRLNGMAEAMQTDSRITPRAERAA